MSAAHDLTKAIQKDLDKKKKTITIVHVDMKKGIGRVSKEKLIEKLQT